MTTSATLDSNTTATDLESLRLAHEVAHTEFMEKAEVLTMASNKVREAEAASKPKALTVEVKLDDETMRLSRDDKGSMRVFPHSDANAYHGADEREIVCKLLKHIGQQGWRIETLHKCLQAASDAGDLGADFHSENVDHILSMLGSELWHILADSKAYCELLERGSLESQLEAACEAPEGTAIEVVAV